MERCPTKSGILERAETVGSVGFLISSCVVGSSPIFWASLFLGPGNSEKKIQHSTHSGNSGTSHAHFFWPFL